MSRKSIFSVIYFLLLVIFTPFYFVSASTDISSDISQNTTWVKSGSPYIIKNDISIIDGATLTIESGTVIKFDYTTELSVYGALDAQGSGEEPIIFTSIADDSFGGDTNSGDGLDLDPNVGDWFGVSFYNNATSSNIKNTKMYFSYWNIINQGSKINIENSVFKNMNRFLLSIEGNNNIKDTSLENISDSAILSYVSSKIFADGLNISNILAYGKFADIFQDSSLVLNNSNITGVDTASGLRVFEGSDLDMDSSIISGFDKGITDYGSGDYGPDSLKITNSQIKNNKFGLSFYDGDTVLSVYKNNISGNSVYGAQSYSGVNINLKNNFWGDVSGPKNNISNVNGLGNEVYFPSSSNTITFKPWLNSWPSEIVCCSSVIFVPGFEGSRLYEKNAKGKLNQRWEAGIASLTDVKSLFLNNDGSSVKDNIVTKDIIEQTNYNLPDSINLKLYKSVSDLFRSQKTQGSINDFYQYSYDWRSDVSDISNNGTMTDTGVVKLKDKIVSMSQNSITGKVTLIGHSNGGLIIKKVIALLKDNNQSDLVDRVILVASPQLGTPATVGSLLHGDDLSVGYNFVLDPVTGRSWAQNMPGAYGLLPSEKLYNKIGSFINFGNSVDNGWYNLYGDNLDYNEQLGFLTGADDSRNQPKDRDLINPLKLNPSLISKSINLHDSIDDLNFPADMEVDEIAGIGKYTVKGYDYFNTLNGYGSLQHKPYLTCGGDGTVIAESAVDVNKNPYYLNLFSYGKDTGNKFKHSDIFENPELIKLISNLITNGNENTPHITKIIPDMTNCRFKIFGMFSPVDIDVYDSQGRHVGVNKDKSTSAFKVFDTEIPGSEFFMEGDKKFAIVPDDGNYIVKLDGTGTGLYTLTVTTQEDGDNVDEISFSDLPTTTNLKGQIAIDTSSNDEPVLNVDTDGDGTFEQQLSPNNGASPLSYLEVVRATILELDLSKKLEKSLLSQLDKIINLVKKNKIDKATEKIQKFLKRLDTGHKVIKEMSQGERDDLTDKINQFLNNL